MPAKVSKTYTPDDKGAYTFLGDTIGLKRYGEIVREEALKGSVDEATATTFYVTLQEAAKSKPEVARSLALDKKKTETFLKYFWEKVRDDVRGMRIEMKKGGRDIKFN